MKMPGCYWSAVHPGYWLPGGGIKKRAGMAFKRELLEEATATTHNMKCPGVQESNDSEKIKSFRPFSTAR